MSEAGPNEGSRDAILRAAAFLALCDFVEKRTG